MRPILEANAIRAIFPRMSSRTQLAPPDRCMPRSPISRLCVPITWTLALTKRCAIRHRMHT